MPFCSNCGQKIEDKDKFCPGCGTPNRSSQPGNQSSKPGGYGAAQQSGTIMDTGQYGQNVSELPKDYVLEGRYRIEKKLGKGGFGTVYKAWDNNVDDYKALKVIDNIFYDDKRVIASLKKETKLLMQINSKYVVRIWDVHLSGEVKFIDMEYIDGGDLVDLMLSCPEEKVSEEKVIELAKQICKGMIDIHSYNIIHKDLKPQNVMLTKSGQIKIMDFGISETFRSSMSRMKETSKSGTPAYMSPEQLLGKDVGKESDIWSFGIMLYELLTGKQLYTGASSNEVYFQIKEREFEPINGIDSKLNNVLDVCLKKEFRERFHNFTELLDALNKKEELIEQISTPQKDVKVITQEKKTHNPIILNNMVFVQGGTFQMGSYNEDSDEKPVHSATVSDLYIGKYQVTQKEWQAVMGNNPSDFKGDSNPVETVSWYDAVEFCNKLSEKEGLTKCYTIDKTSKDLNNQNEYDEVKWTVVCDFNANGYRLPTEAEWEFAARGGNTSKGYTYSGSNNIDKVAWYDKNSYDKGSSHPDYGTHPVGQKQANELGIYDLTGNVWEWCWDWYGNYSSGSQTNPKGADNGSDRVRRGGGWCTGASYCRVALRYGYDPDVSCNTLGFRLSRSSR